MPEEAPLPWRRLASEPGPDLIVARARFDTLENPRTGAALRRLVLDAPGWVNVVARTRDLRYVLVRQYRFGTERVTLEVPGGVVDAGEEPLETARRELAEETGYTSDDWRLLAVLEPNPAFQSNLCYQFLAEGCERTREPSLDPGEDIGVELLGEAELLEGLRSGEINHSLVVCALARVLDISSPQREEPGRDR